MAQDSDAFVDANILSIFYHELGHAVIDIEELPIFGQEEDAADVFSIFLIDTFFTPEAAYWLAYDAAWGFAAEAETNVESLGDVAWWDTHGPDEQRYYNTVCIFYGADPEARGAFAEELGLPEDRAESCPFEYDQAALSWGAVLDDMLRRGAGESLVLGEMDTSRAAELIREEVAALNAELQLAAPVEVEIARCGEANAYYDPEFRKITFCAEFEPHLRALAAALE